jgi:hypothetical protein
MRYLLPLLAIASLTSAEELSFNRDVRPILSANCFGCHGPSSDRKAKLRLDVREGALDANRKNGAVIIPGNPDASLFMQRVLSTDPDEIMPPPESHKTLTPEQKNILVRWIKQGAEYQGHWSFLPVKSAPPAAVADKRWDKHPIDRLVYAEFDQAKPQPEADRRTLIRRVSLDLTGLPPTPTEVTIFVNDKRPDAYERLVERLLGSSRYGEHMARYWLDLVRYGDSHGIHADNYREMFPYRDWVIRAFNDNQPFDQFAIDQMAGDLRQKPTQAQMIASGFNRLHVSNSAKEELYVNNVTDRVNAFGTVFLGLTLGCATCHDHKYDPISQKEYFQFFAYFNNLDGDPDNKGVKSPEPSLAIKTPEQATEEARLSKAWHATNKEAEKKRIRNKLDKLRASFPTTLVMKERKSPRQAYILVRGEYDNKGEKVGRATPTVLPPMAASLPNDRLGLAHWLTAPENPLVARVTVNRFWQQLFGVGLVKTSEDFGSQGEWPSHPELLDYLAHRFVANGWNVKAFMRFLVTSETYKQSSAAGPDAYAADPENRRIARGPRFRMDAELLRDQALFTSGQLVEKLYGRSVKPPQPPGLWESVAMRVSKPRTFTPDTGDNTLRRSLYTYWKRAYPPPAMTVFNAPTREVCTSRRERTNTPLQALVLMNEEQFFTASKDLARLANEAGSTPAIRINWLFETLTSRLPSPEETKRVVQTLALYKANGYTDDHTWTMIANALLNLDEVKTKQ